MAAARRGHFGPGFFTFLEALDAHNDREWFKAHRDRYVEDVEQPMLGFITDVAGPLATISRRFVAEPARVGGSMLRIHRDMRFAKDRTPFIPRAAARFSHEAKGRAASVPGFYLHLSPTLCIGGGGIHEPDPKSLRRIREAIVARAADWKALRRRRIEVDGDALSRAPAGFDPLHPLIEDIRRTSFYSMTVFSRAQVTSPRFLSTYIATCRRVSPLVRFLADALGLRV